MLSRAPHVPSEVAEATPELDVTPVMNMFVILIPFLVSMAVFTHVSIVDFSLPPNVGAGLDAEEGKPKLKMTVVVAEDFLLVTHGESLLDSIPNRDGTYDYEAFSETVAARRGEIEIKDEVIVAVRDPVQFEFVIKVMDRCREAGFARIGLSTATEEPESGT